jgi:hypothetical protein
MPPSQIDELGESGPKGGGATIADAIFDVLFEPGDLASRDRSEPLSSSREVNPRCARILRIGPPLNEAGAFDGSNHRRHRLLREV